MPSPLLAALLTLALQEAPAAPEPPDPERVKEVLVGIDLALKKDEPGLIVAAFGEARGVGDGDVASAVARALKDKRPEVHDAAVETLRFLPHPTALKELENFARRERKELKDDPLFFAAVLRACAQHAQEDTIELLVSDVWSTTDRRVFKARVLGLANIRSDASLEALLNLTNQAGKDKLQPYLEDVRLALMVLTGEDQGGALPPWWDWWNENRKTFHVAPELPKLPRDAEQKWKAFWAAGQAKAPGGGR
jgi:hypothetical protein